MRVDTMTTLADLIGGSRQDAPKAPRPIHEAQIMELRRLFANYGRTDRFKPGDLVMRPSDGAAGRLIEPYIVLELRPDPPVDWSAGRPGASNHGARLDIRVMTLCDNEYGPLWLESWMFEPYEPPAATDAAAALPLEPEPS
jgi:hypothetical protein